MENHKNNEEFIFVPWTLPDDTKIDLITPGALHRLADGTELTSIMGKKAIVGQDRIADEETNGGILGYGLPSRATDTLAYRGLIPGEYLRVEELTE